MKILKSVVASIFGALPLIPVILLTTGTLRLEGSGVFRTTSVVCDVLLVPAILLAILYKADATVTILFVSLWCAFCSWVFIATSLWLMVGLDSHRSEEHPFDWWRFWVRFFFGAVFGGIIGWRVWIKLPRTWSENVYLSLVCIAVCVSAVGLLTAFSREDFWHRP